MPISFVMEVVKLKRFLLAFLATCGLVIGLFAMKPHEAFAACNWLTDPACNAWSQPEVLPGQQTVGQNNLIVKLTFTDSNFYPVTFHLSNTNSNATASSYSGGSIPFSYIGPSTVNHGQSITFDFNIPANYFAPANLSPGAYQATFNASFSVTAVSSINLVSTTQTISAPSAPFKVIVGQATNPNCIPGVTCPGGPPPVQTLSATMTLQATTPGGMDEPAGTAKFGDQITATVTATSPNEPPPPPNAVSFAWTGPTTITAGSLNFPGIPNYETQAPVLPSSAFSPNAQVSTAFSGPGTTTAFSPGTPDTANKVDTLSASIGGPPGDTYVWCGTGCGKSTIEALVSSSTGAINPNRVPQLIKKAEFVTTASDVAQITFLEDFGGFGPFPEQSQGVPHADWNRGGAGWPVTSSLTVQRSGVFTLRWSTTTCSGTGKSRTCHTVWHTAQDPVTVTAQETVAANLAVIGTNRWALGVWAGGN